MATDTQAHPAPRPKDWVMGIHAYVPGKAATAGGGAVAKLSSNENPLGQSAAARDAFAARATGLDRYPDAAATALRAAIAAPLGLDPARVIQGAGSDEVLNMAVGVYAGPGDEVIHVRYGFAMYEIATRRVGATPVIVADKDYGTDVDAILAAVTERTTLVFVANPNNPTGTYVGRDEIARLHAGLRPDIMLVIDQAYAEYLTAAEDDGALELAKTAANVIVTRTFSKIYGLAGERIGWGYGPAAAIDAMHRIRGPFNVTTAGQAAAIAAVADTGFVDASRVHNDRWLAWMTAEVEALGNAGLRAVPSRGNFLLVLFEGRLTAEAAYTGLMEAGYITRWLPGQGLGHGLRITIGTEGEVRGVVAALRALIDAAG